jgi:hypothetical protein
VVIFIIFQQALFVVMQVFTIKKGGVAHNWPLKAQENIYKLWCKAPVSLSLYKAIVSNPRDSPGLTLSFSFQV